MLERTGQPLADPSILPMLELCKGVSDHVTVCLSGDGADEIFGGYQRYIGARLSQIFRKIPKFLRNYIVRFVDNLDDPHTHHSSSLLKKLKLFLIFQDYYDRCYVAPLLTSKTAASSILNFENGKKWSPPAWVRDESLVVEMMRKDIVGYLPQDILRKVDAASMAFSLEVRSPFLDVDLVDVAMRYGQGDFLGYGLSGKMILRKVFREELPSFVWKKSKQGFISPVAKALNKGVLYSELYELTYSVKQDLINRDFVASLLDQHLNGSDHSQILWAVYVFLIWYDKQFGDMSYG